MKCSHCEGGGLAPGTNARCPLCWGLKVVCPLTDPEVMRIVGDAGAVIANGHFELAGNQHTSSYVDKDRLFRCHQRTSLLCKEMASRFLGFGQSVRVVVTPHGGSFAMAQWTAFHLQDPRGPQIWSAYASEPAGDALGSMDHLTFRPGFEEIVRDQRIFVLDDIWTRGGTTKKVIDAARRFDADVVGAACLVNRGGVRPQDLGLRSGEIFLSLANITMDAFDAAVCQLCDDGIALNKTLGHGARRK